MIWPRIVDDQTTDCYGYSDDLLEKLYDFQSALLWLAGNQSDTLRIHVSKTRPKGTVTNNY